MELKEWYKSRTVWVGILTTVSVVLKGMGWLPDFVNNSFIDEAAGVCLGLATIYFRIKAEKLIAPMVAPIDTTK
jgi:hypothetical protein